MAPGEELKTKAREFEHAQRIPEALDRYLHLARELEGAAAAAVWQRIGDLQLQAGDPAAAMSSAERALDLYRTAGQKNNALAVARGRADSEAADPAIHLAFLRLALELDYPVFAREAVGAVLVLAVRGELPDESIEDVAAFLERFGVRPRCSPEELVEGLPAADEQRTVSVLARLWRVLSDRGRAEIADRVRVEILRMDPQSDPQPSAPRPVSAPSSGALVAPLPLIDAGDPGDAHSIEIPRLEGLEPTHAGLEREAVIEEAGDVPEEISAGTSPASAAEDQEKESDEALDDEDFDDPLPLLIPSLPSAPEDSGPATGGEGWGNEERETLADLAAEADPGGGTGAADVQDADGALAMPPLDLASISQELEKITTREVAPSDAASHYDVGVAFKDMGMMEDAIARLAAAFIGGHNPLATLEVLGEILVEQDRYESAARVLGFARTAGTEFDEAMVGVLYWLARSDEVRGRAADARALLSRVVSVAPSFRDAAQRLEALPS